MTEPDEDATEQQQQQSLRLRLERLAEVNRQRRHRQPHQQLQPRVQQEEERPLGAGEQQIDENVPLSSKKGPAHEEEQHTAAADDAAPWPTLETMAALAAATGVAGAGGCVLAPEMTAPMLLLRPPRLPVATRAGAASIAAVAAGTLAALMMCRGGGENSGGGMHGNTRWCFDDIWWTEAAVLAGALGVAAAGVAVAARGSHLLSGAATGVAVGLGLGGVLGDGATCRRQSITKDAPPPTALADDDAIQFIVDDSLAGAAGSELRWEK
jgi:hypothetical protein